MTKCMDMNEYSGVYIWKLAGDALTLQLRKRLLPIDELSFVLVHADSSTIHAC